MAGVHHAISCPECGQSLDRLTMHRTDHPEEGPRMYLLVAGRLDAEALRNTAKLMLGWADQLAPKKRRAAAGGGE